MSQRKAGNQRMDRPENRVHITYSAEQQKQLADMRAKYRPGDGHTAGNLDTLRKMDARVEGKAQACALTEGIISTLILGIGMTCVLKWDMPAAGVLVGAAGLAGVVYAWPLYQKVLKKEREKAVRELPESGGNA